MLDITAIATFCRAVEAGNLTEAAKALHITKSVASRRIQALEEELGVRLLKRSTRGVTPTEEGTAVYERGVRIMSDLDDLKTEAGCARQHLSGTIRMTAPKTFGEAVLMDPIAAFMKANPGVTFELDLSDERVDVTGGGYDLALRIAASLDDSALISRRILPLESLVVASPEYLERRGTPQVPEDLKAHDCIFYRNVTASEQWRFDGAHGPMSVKVNGPLITNSGIAQARAAIAGIGIAILPRFFVYQALCEGRLVPILGDWFRRPMALYALYPEKRLMPIKVGAFVDFLANWFTEPDHLKGL
ncbi:LysR family transcriptional regulator [Gimibacter soli]|uniref:LysR family transcriptional regulator n=1 Tax=Gimibacter soli TaxID=3024400 RepID=A0AAE9XP81_9PROT|nr:LysR family transcriptional regulator [Gimibacter soli]WCL54668.1 LysR family transcriptional regulator [Gimibacter soli]